MYSEERGVGATIREEQGWSCASRRDDFVSRGFSVQVNIVAVSDHVFHRFPLDLLIQVFATQLSLFLCIP